MTRWLLAVVLTLGVTVATRSAAEPTPCPTPSSTFQLIQRGIFEQHGCTQDFCHGAAKQAGLDLRPGKSYQSLLNPNDGGDPVDFKLVAPGRPEESLLWLVLAAKTLERPNVPGTPMPLSAVPLGVDELEGLRLWIAARAPAEGIVPHVADLIDACPASSEGSDAGLPACQRNDPTLLLPELHPEPPTDIRMMTENGHRIIYFSTVIRNTGQGPLVIQAAQTPTHPGELVDAEQIISRSDGSKCTHPAGPYRFSETGHGWEYNQMANFSLRKDDPMTGDLFALRTKTYLCLLDTDAIRVAANIPHQYEAHCYDEVGRMGISSGWKDTYHRVFPGQWIDLDADPEEPVPPGNYYVVNLVNPANDLWEADPSVEDNTSYTRVRVIAKDPDPPVTPVVQPTPVVTPGPRRHPSHPAHPTRLTQPSHPAHPAHPAHAPRPAHARAQVAGPVHGSGQ